MDKNKTKSISKFLSLILRHKPESVGIELDSNGWVDVEVLLLAMGSCGKGISRTQLEQVVETNDKQRFTFSVDGQRIRAHQGHSVDIELNLTPTAPPEILYHGTPEKNIVAIKHSGLEKMNRHHVHLHQDKQLALEVGQRFGRPVLLSIRSSKLHEKGHEFFVTDNQVWLTNHVPAEFIEFPY